jgi:hypothetical protein
LSCRRLRADISHIGTCLFVWHSAVLFPGCSAFAINLAWLSTASNESQYVACREVRRQINACARLQAFARGNHVRNSQGPDMQAMRQRIMV